MTEETVNTHEMSILNTENNHVLENNDQSQAPICHQSTRSRRYEQYCCGKNNFAILVASHLVALAIGVVIGVLSSNSNCSHLVPSNFNCSNSTISSQHSSATQTVATIESGKQLQQDQEATENATENEKVFQSLPSPTSEQKQQCRNIIVLEENQDYNLLIENDKCQVFTEDKTCQVLAKDERCRVLESWERCIVLEDHEECHVYEKNNDIPGNYIQKSNPFHLLIFCCIGIGMLLIFIIFVQRYKYNKLKNKTNNDQNAKNNQT